jgi:tetratricopeptide (TPR) repeat protein
LKQYQSKDRLQVYRSQLLSNAELENLKGNLGQLISINSFWSGNIDRSKALADLNHFKASADLRRVLFEINADPKLSKTKPFTLIGLLDDSADPSEVFFMAASIFSLTDITCNDDQLWIVKMTLCTDEEYDSIFNSIQMKEQNEQNNLRTFAKILWKMDKLDLADEYYHRLINELPSNDPLLMIVYEDLGTMALEKKNYDASVQWFRKSIAIKNQSPDTKADESSKSIRAPNMKIGLFQFRLYSRE